MMLDLEPLNIFHIDELDTEVPNAKEDLLAVLDSEGTKKGYAIMSPNNDVVGIIGGSIISKGVWEGWFYLGKKGSKYAKSLVRTCRHFSDLVVEHDVHRLQIAVLDEYKKWAESLGFQFESVVKNYHRNLDHTMYVKLRGNNGR
jgi:hypothetical protein